MLSEFGFGSDQFSCLDSLYIERERLERARRQPVVVRLRHPAGAARLQDGLGRLGLGEQRRHPDPWGLGYIQGRYGTPCGAWSFKQGHNWY